MSVERDLEDAELLAAALGVPAGPLQEVLVARGGLRALWRAGPELLLDQLSPPRAKRLGATLALFDRLLEPAELPERIEGPESVATYLGPRLAMAAEESFWVVLLDARGRPLGVRQVAVGTLTACLVHPREVFAPAIRVSAASIIVVHNHPSGDPSPSDEDLGLTRRLGEVGRIVGIPLLDHLIIAQGGFRSLGGGLTPDVRSRAG